MKGFYPFCLHLFVYGFGTNLPRSPVSYHDKAVKDRSALETS